jgi:hypothetical protein
LVLDANRRYAGIMYPPAGNLTLGDQGAERLPMRIGLA